LLGQKFIDNFNSLFIAMLGDTVLEPVEAEVINIFLDRQWVSSLPYCSLDYYLRILPSRTAGLVSKFHKNIWMN